MSRKKQNKPPFKLESEVKHLYKKNYIHYVNECSVDKILVVETELKKLTPQCEMLFGKMPQTKSYEERRANEHLLWGIVEKCLWKETRELEGFSTWVAMLGDSCEKFFPTWKAIEIYEKILDGLTQTQIEKDFDYWVSFYSKQYEIPQEKITKDKLDIWLYSDYWKWLADNDETFQKLLEDRRLIITELKGFQQAFDSLLEKFCLGKIWLAESVFRAIWDGTGKLKIEDVYVELVSEEVCDEIEARLDEKEGGIRKEKTKCDFLQTSPRIPFHKPFQYKEHLWLYKPLERYEEKAVEAYRQYIRDYLKLVENTLIENGYKRPHAHKYETLKWLVARNILGWSKDKILQEIADTTSVDSDVSRIDKAFRQFKIYDLPVRE